MITLKKIIPILTAIALLSVGSGSALAQTNGSVLYVPLIGITSVPEPLALPKGAGNIIYKYAVKNFLAEVALTDVQVVDDTCSPVKFVEGDDNGDSKLDYGETWRYTCSIKLSETTQSIATATGFANNTIATHKAYATVVIGSDSPPPLVSIINVTKVAYPLSLPIEGGSITFTYKVNNPGVTPLSDVSVSDDKCYTMSGRLGDTNGNSLLDIHEVWIYTCTATLNHTTTNTVNVTAFANGLKAIGNATITVKVDSPDFPDLNIPRSPDMGTNFNFKIIVWICLSAILTVLIVFSSLTGKKGGKIRKP